MLAIALLVFSAIGTLVGLYVVLLLLSRLSSLRRLSGLLTAHVGDIASEDVDPFSLTGPRSPTGSLVRMIRRETDAGFVLLFLPRPGDDRLTVALSDGASSTAEAAELSYFHPLVRRLSDSSALLEISGPDEDIALPSGTLLFPILARGSLIGIMAVGPRPSGRPISERLRDTIALAASQAAAPLENMQLYTSLRRAFSDLEDAQRELLALQRISLAAQSTLRLDEVLDQITLGVVDALSFDTSTVYLVDVEARVLSTPVGHGPGAAVQARSEPIPFDEHNPSIRALLAQEVFITRDLRESVLPRLIEAGALSARDLQADLTVVNLPLASKGRVIGGMVLTTRRTTVSERQIESLRTFAGQAAATIENARLYGQLERAYADLRTAQEQLIRAERLRTLGQVASGVAHDFNNILAAILTRAQLAGQQTRSPALRETLAVIEQAALDGASITKRIQSLARPRADAALSTVDLNQMVQQALDITQPMWMNAAKARGVSISSETHFDAHAQMEGQASELREVITNLILNATAAMPMGGTLRLETAERDGQVWCTIADTGTGMSDDIRHQIFDPFFTTKGAAGSGLGLSIVAAILERHHGKIEIETKPGLGTTVRVGFPIATSGVTDSQQRRRRRARVSLQLLIVEEDERTREALSLILSRYGHRVLSAATVEEAIRLLQAQEFDVVITDLGLGDRSGWEVAEASKSLHPRAAVVLLTAWVNQWTLDETQARGVDAILAKPFAVDEVLSCLEKALIGSA